MTPKRPTREAVLAERMGSRLDSWIYKHVMRCEPTVNTPAYSSDVKMDYTVLAYVKQDWSRPQLGRFCQQLAGLWKSRVADDQSVQVFEFYCSEYHPGDYGRAALLAVLDDVDPEF